MVDLLAHALFAYAVGATLQWVGTIERRHVAVVVVGGVLPDVAKAHLVVGSGAVEAAVGLPFSWLALHRLGAVLAFAALGALLFARAERSVAFGTLVGGGLLHLALDALVIRADGRAPPYLYPLSWWRPPSGDLYLSSDLWPTAVAVVLAATAWWMTRRGG